MSTVLGLHHKFRKLFLNKQTYFSVRALGVLCVSKALLIHIVENANGQRLNAKVNKSPSQGPTLRSESRRQTCLRYAEPRGGRRSQGDLGGG